MVAYTCDKVFMQKGHYDYHKARKRPCKKNDVIEKLVEKKVQEAPRVVLLALASRIGVSAETIDALLESGSYFENDQSQREFLDELCTALDLEQGELFSQTQGMLSGSCFSLYAKDPALLEKIAAESKLLDDAIT